ncbi:MAG: hypothetical protein PHV55_08915 [Candidatus Omnitrophica bacterium]|nr:hypothetical protein [Candidatus Omnitrophota bacterium]
MNNELKQQVEGILIKIADVNKGKLVQNFFENDVERYLKKMSGLEDLIIDNKISQDNAYASYTSYSDYLIEKMADVEDAINKKETLKQIKQIFRKQASGFINKIFLMQWGYNKPSGHPGDYKLIEMLYDAKPLSEGLSFYGDKYLFKDSYVQAIRIRKDMMKTKLIDFVENFKNEKIDVMNLGSGSCREIKELLDSTQFPFNKKLILTLIDWDKNALEFSRKALSDCRADLIKLNFAQENIVDLYKSPEKYLKNFGTQDLIYSIGLIDYLPNLVLGEVIKFCFNLLKKRGTLILAHKNVKVHKSIASDWFCDWSFFPRNEEDVKTIANEYLKDRNFTWYTAEDKTRHIFFIEVTKQ